MSKLGSDGCRWCRGAQTLDEAGYCVDERGCVQRVKARRIEKETTKVVGAAADAGDSDHFSGESIETVVPKWGGPCETPVDAATIITRLCRLLSEAWNVFDPEAHSPNDCFCGEGGFQNANKANWRSAGYAVSWVEALVRNALHDARRLRPSEVQSCPHCGKVLP